MKKYIVIFFVALIYGVGESSAVFLLISPSPSSNALGRCGVSNISSDIYSSFFNPAHSIIPKGISVQYSSVNTPWLPNLSDDLILGSKVARISYNGNISFYNNNYDAQLSISHLELNLDLGEQPYTEDGDILYGFRSEMLSKWNTLSIGLKSKKQPIYFSLGITNKEAIQSLPGDYYSEDKLYDWGFRLFIDGYRPPSLKSFLITYSLGYSKSNIGDLIYFSNSQQGYPAPRMARLGMGLGVKFVVNKTFPIGIRFMQGAESLLIENGQYIDGFLGKINFPKHIIYFSDLPDEDDVQDGVTVYRGMEINIADIYYYRRGEYADYEGKVIHDTNGFGINFSNMILFLNNYTIRNFKIHNLFNLVSIERNYSEYDAEYGHPLDNIEFDEYTFTINLKFSFLN